MSKERYLELLQKISTFSESDPDEVIDLVYDELDAAWNSLSDDEKDLLNGLDKE